MEDSIFYTLPILESDGYKQTHPRQYNKDITKLVSYMTPRKSRLPFTDKMMFFGLQAFCKKFLIERFNTYFFNRPLDEVIDEYTDVIDNMLGADAVDIRKIIDLHKLGYLPIEIWALAEGTLVPMQVPCVEITNTDDRFAWVVQWVESVLSSEIWKPCIHAQVGYWYRQVVDKYYDLTAEDDVPRSKAMSDFGFRGMSCEDEAVKASAAWLMSFSGTATIPAVPYIEHYYYGRNDITDLKFATNLISTEHSVMASNFAIDGNERAFVKRLLTEIYPHNSFSMVSDTYDYWNMVDNILPSLKDEILAHDGTLFVRPDSGDIVEVAVESVVRLWKHFGGVVNSKGYKVLNDHIRVVYGDGVTQKRAELIYQRLMELGFAANNISFGAGSFSFNCIEYDGKLMPFTRDTFCVAIKATAGFIGDKFIPIFKDPKTDKVDGQNFKKSQKGYCWVFSENGELRCTDGHDHENHYASNTEMQKVFEDSRMVNEETIYSIRKRIYGDKF